MSPGFSWSQFGILKSLKTWVYIYTKVMLTALASCQQELLVRRTQWRFNLSARRVTTFLFHRLFEQGFFAINNRSKSPSCGTRYSAS